MSLERVPELGSKPVSLAVKLPAVKPRAVDQLGDGLRDLYRRNELTDVTMVCANQTFHAHRAVLAAQSEVFKHGLTASKDDAGTKQEVRLADIANPEAVQIMLDYIYHLDSAVYEEYNPRTQEVNKDVLRLSQNFRLPGLTERAMHWIAKGITTGNAVERLKICDDFDLTILREKIIEQLAMNKRALAEVANSTQIMGYPKLMQALLQQAAGVPEEEESQPAKKRGRKA